MDRVAYEYIALMVEGFGDFETMLNHWGSTGWDLAGFTRESKPQGDYYRIVMKRMKDTQITGVKIKSVIVEQGNDVALDVE